MKFKKYALSKVGHSPWARSKEVSSDIQAQDGQPQWETQQQPGSSCPNKPKLEDQTDNYNTGCSKEREHIK